jgi:peroxiredoxin
LPLLLEEKPLPMLLDGVRDQDLVLDEPGRIGDYDCYRVRFNRSEGSGEYWIDQKTFVLRRMRFDQPPVPSREGEPAMRGVSMVVNFERARLGGAIDDASVFKVVVPEGTQCHRALLDPGPYALVGTKLSEFQFTDLQGKPWSSQAIAGKSAVIYFWKSDITEADPMIATIEQFYGKYKENDKLAILAVTLDHPDTPAKTIEEAAKQLKINVPLLRETGIEARDRLRIVGAPTTLFIDAKGVLQDCIIGYIPTAAAAAPRKLERLLAGEDLAQQTREEFQRQFREIEKAVDIQFSGEAQTAVVQQARPTPAAAKREPVKLRLKPQWKCEAVRPAGNILVTKEPGAAPRIFVIEDFRSVSELGVDGKRIATYKPQIAKQEFFINLRSGAGRDGKRYFVAFAPIEQRFHLFDEKFNLLLSYPADALENRHAGLSDVELGDLNGDGVLKAYVGFAGPVGVKCVSLQGRPIWSCRTLFNIGNVVPGPANAQGQSDLYCVNDFSSVAVLDSQGRLRDAVRLIVEGTLQYLTHGDLSGNGAETWCGIMFVPDPQHTSGKFTALGMNPNFTVAWKYALPSGTEQAVEPIVVGRLLPGAARQWILPGCDGSIHVLAGDGTLIDRFNYGEQVNGLATVEIDGKPVLLISSANGVEALRVE